MPPKRKRTATHPKKPPETPVPQPSSRDASDEDAEDPVLQEVSALKQRQDGMQPPSKRMASSKLSRSSTQASEPVSSDADSPMGRGRPTKKRPQDMENDDFNVEKEEQDAAAESATRGMKAPPKAGLVDPVGYHTNPPPTGRAVRVYADGVFDLFHLGHMRQLEQAKKAFPNTQLIVGVTGDAETHLRKGLTVLSAAERAETVRHCRWVDAVIEDCPWIVTADFLRAHRIDFVAHDDLPYGAAEGDDIYKPIKEAGMFLVTQRTEGVSTTGIITKIVRDYESYIARQLSRGTKRQDLNVSWLKKNELDLKHHVKDLRETIKSNWAQTGQELGKELRQFWQLSRPSSPGPSVLGNYFPMAEAAREGEASSLSESQKPSPLIGRPHLSHLDVPRSPTSSNMAASEFATGYSLGLVGGIRSWMTRNRRNVLSLSRPVSQSPDSEGEGEGEGRMREQRGRGRMRSEEGRKRRNMDDQDEEKEQMDE